jgi:hypothetical protein
LSRFLVDIAESSGKCSIPTTLPSGWTIRANTCHQKNTWLEWTAVKYPDPQPTSRTLAPGLAYSSNAVAAFACICGAEIYFINPENYESTVCECPIGCGES